MEKIMKNLVFGLFLTLSASLVLAVVTVDSWDAISDDPANIIGTDGDVVNLHNMSGLDMDSQPLMDCPEGDFTPGSNSRELNFCEEADSSEQITGWIALEGYGGNVPTDFKLTASTSSSTNPVDVLIFSSRDPISSSTDWEYVGTITVAGSLTTYTLSHTSGSDVESIVVGREVSPLYDSKVSVDSIAVVY